jgi:hypothetical protein
MLGVPTAEDNLMLMDLYNSKIEVEVNNKYIDTILLIFYNLKSKYINTSKIQS